jgi:hypothetical protein
VKEWRGRRHGGTARERGRRIGTVEAAMGDGVVRGVHRLGLDGCPPTSRSGTLESVPSLPCPDVASRPTRYRVCGSSCISTARPCHAGLMSQQADAPGLRFQERCSPRPRPCRTLELLQVSRAPSLAAVILELCGRRSPMAMATNGTAGWPPLMSLVQSSRRC